jgi:hypothetical protein
VREPVDRSLAPFETDQHTGESRNPEEQADIDPDDVMGVEANAEPGSLPTDACPLGPPPQYQATGNQEEQRQPRITDGDLPRRSPGGTPIAGQTQVHLVDEPQPFFGARGA